LKERESRRERVWVLPPSEAECQEMAFYLYVKEPVRLIGLLRYLWGERDRGTTGVPSELMSGNCGPPERKSTGVP